MFEDDEALAKAIEFCRAECDLDAKPDVAKWNYDVFGQLGIDGDDASEFIEKFAREFDVDMQTYRWYFHHGDEAFGGLGGIFFKPPHARVEAIPISLDDLAEAIRTKRWPIIYPNHQLPSRRWDMTINQVVSLALMALLLAVMISKCTH